MNIDDLGAWLLHGHLLVVGQFRGVRIEIVGYVDRKSGLAAPFLRVTYIVERDLPRGMELIMISRSYPEPHPDPAVIAARVEKGRYYMFEVVSFKRDKNGLATATMDAGNPVVLESVAPPAPAPPGAGAGGCGA